MSEPTTLLTGLVMGEAPRWHVNRLWCTDMGAGEVPQTVELDRGGFACALGGARRRTLFIVAAEFPVEMGTGTRTGQVLMLEAPAPGAGWP